MTDQLKRAISAAKTAQTNSEQAESISVASSSAGDQNFDMSESSYKTSHTAIRKARRFAMQGLYEWLVTDHRFDTNGKLGWKANAPHDIAARTRATNAMHTVHIGYYHEMMHEIPEQIEVLNALITQHLDREIDKLDTVEHAILLIGAFELQNRLEIPYKVVLDEAMKLNNHFGATDAHKLINAVLDRMAVELRDVEVQADIRANLRTSQKAATKKTVPQVVTTENTAAPDDNSKSEPTASTKPRISANNASVKRNRPNKANAGSNSVKEALARSSIPAAEVSAEPVATDTVDNLVNTAVDPMNTDDATINQEAVVNEAIDSQSTDSNETITLDLNSAETVNPEITDTKTDNSDLNSAELESTVVNEVSSDSAVDSVVPSAPDTDLISAETNSTEAADTKTDSSDTKSKD